MSEAGEGRAQGDDPLVLALRAIQAFERSFGEFGTDTHAMYQAAQLRTLWALAAEVRALRSVLEGQLRTLWALAAEVRALRFELEGDDDAQGDA